MMKRMRPSAKRIYTRIMDRWRIENAKIGEIASSTAPLSDYLHQKGIVRGLLIAADEVARDQGL